MKDDETARSMRALAADCIQKAKALMDEIAGDDGVEKYDRRSSRAEAYLRAAGECEWVAGADHWNDPEIPQELTLNLNVRTEDVTP